MPILVIKIGDQSIKGNENAGVSTGDTLLIKNILITIQ